MGSPVQNLLAGKVTSRQKTSQVLGTAASCTIPGTISIRPPNTKQLRLTFCLRRPDERSSEFRAQTVAPRVSMECTHEMNSPPHFGLESCSGVQYTNGLDR